jgi:hypothetical protein
LGGGGGVKGVESSRFSRAKREESKCEASSSGGTSSKKERQETTIWRKQMDGCDEREGSGRLIASLENFLFLGHICKSVFLRGGKGRRGEAKKND